MHLRIIASLAIAFLCIFVGPVAANPTLYEPGVDPAVGVNLVSWWNFGGDGAAVWENAVQDVFDHGIRSVSLVPIRFVDLSTGRLIAEPHSNGPDLAHVAAGAARASALGMSVTINPFVEADNFSQWRGTINFSGAQKTNFFQDYTDYLGAVAQVARDNAAARMTIGSELNALVSDSSHNDNWAQVIDAVDAVYQGPLGYAANWDNYRNANVTATIWENQKIDYLGLDAYFPQATNAQADASGLHPDETFIDMLSGKWNTILNTNDGLGGEPIGVLGFAQARKQGAGMPVVFTESGLIPFNRTTVQPWSESPGYTQPQDSDEQVNGYDALLRATDGLATRLPEIDFWHWGMPGAADSFWYIHPEGVDVGGSKFQESLGNPAAQFLVAYVPEPSSISLCVLALVSFSLALCWRGRRVGWQPWSPENR